MTNTAPGGTIMTVCGPVKTSDLGFTLTHEHFILNTSYLTGNRDSFLYDRVQAVKEAMHYKDAGGVSVVDLTNNGLRPEPATIRWLAEQTGLHIVMGCGWYREQFYDRSIWSRTTANMAEELVHDIEHGFSDTGVRPGVIGEIGCDGGFVSPAEERVFRAVARAHKRTGLSVITHALDSPVGLAQLAVLAEEGADLRRVAVAHCATWPDPDYHEAIARRGAYAQFDVNGRFPHEVEYQLRQILEFINRGHLEHLLISHDICLRSQWVGYGGKGYAYIRAQFVAVLRQAGLSQQQVDTIFIENPRRWLAGR